MLAPVALRFAVPPGQMDVLLPALTTGRGCTVTNRESLLTHPFASVPVTTYLVVLAGFAVGDETVVDESPAEGLQLYVLAPFAFSEMLLPKHKEVSRPASTTGNAFTVMMTVVVSAHPAPLVPITVYVVVAVGCAMTVLPVVALRPVAGLQLNAFAPEAVSDVDDPMHIDFVPLTDTTGLPFTATVI